MTDEQIWLLKYGSRWVDWWELANADETGVDALCERLHEGNKLERDHKKLRVRLKPKEKDESIRV